MVEISKTVFLVQPSNGYVQCRSLLDLLIGVRQQQALPSQDPLMNTFRDMMSINLYNYVCAGLISLARL